MNEKWGELLRRIPVKKGEFYYVPHGTIHAIGKGLLILETQQNSDTTYRLYDYDRKDSEGNTRELHIEESIAVTTIPGSVAQPEPSFSNVTGGTITKFIANQFFFVFKWEIDDKITLYKEAPYTLATVIEGSGNLTIENQNYSLVKGSSFLLPSEIEEWTITGQLVIIASFPGKDGDHC